MLPSVHASGPFGSHWVPCVSKGSTPLSRPQRIWGHWVSDRVSPPKPVFGHRLWSGRGGTPPHLIRLFLDCDACCNRITRQPRFVIFFLIYRNCILSPDLLIANRGKNGRAAVLSWPSIDSAESHWRQRFPATAKPPP